jgi:protoporphyrinogen oxidase
MGDDLLAHRRKACVRVVGQWTDYPFQDHIHQLEPELARQCRQGLMHAPGPGAATHSFKDWINHSFGDGISKLFMEPYNRKVWRGLKISVPLTFYKTVQLF